MLQHKFLAAAIACLMSLPLSATEIPLYETGPAEDAAFIRFVNGTQASLNIAGGQAKNVIQLTSDKPVSDFVPVAANRPLKGVFEQDATKAPSETVVKPGEFVTVVAVPDQTKGLALQTIRETPEEFNALKASLALYNLSSQCGQATLKVSGKDVEIFSNVAADTASIRRMINPIKLDVQLLCNAKPVGKPMSLGQLSAGERYTLFVLPENSATGTRLYPSTDTISF
ncbi:alginate O-acetyltransferase AlgF [Pusillimonas sp. NJUB218]|uniref:alginate O-acetyltransferase AlgF n=1 Tax=Pusillimonas sp. NJUB218 TaxID=2023230 RepID=UPI000F4CF7B5|nr:alginate O-acetyltransferase AlgF [Pusillimonas sp. NJUB218]ROT44751.1 hypothetical protein CHR62_09950 [Pusillimonas sp. NJUB218]